MAVMMHSSRYGGKSVGCGAVSQLACKPCYLAETVLITELFATIREPGGRCSVIVCALRMTQYSRLACQKLWSHQ